MHHYFDHMASTACHPEVIKTMVHYLEDSQLNANASATHYKGIICQNEIKQFETKFLSYLGKKSGRIIWTSGATESINLALQGLCQQYRQCGMHIISTNTEHKASLATFEKLKQEGFKITLLPVRNNGLIAMEDLEKSIQKDTILVSITHVHNELGCIQDIDKIGQICYKKGIMLHLDCAQTIGKTSMRLPDTVTAASFSAHKCYGPQGIGALFLGDKPKRKIKPIIHGGGQQSAARSGTMSLFLIAGFVKAIDLFHNHHLDHEQHYKELRQRFINKLHKKISWNSDKHKSAKQLIHICLPTVDLNALEKLKQTFCLSSHSACQSSSYSHVLNAIGHTLQQQETALRISLAHDTTLEQVDALILNINNLIR